MSPACFCRAQTSHMNPRPGCSALFSVLRSVWGSVADSTEKASKVTVVNEPSDQNW